jgi:flagellar biosynthesis GTPase FlhF
MSTAFYDTATYDAAPRVGHPGAPREGYSAAAPDHARQHSGHHRGRHGSAPAGAPGDFAPRIYRGRSVDELVPRIVAELGEDAVVIRHHRGLTGGFAGFFQRPFVEIEARRGAPGIDLYDGDDAAPVLPEEAALPGEAAPAPAGEIEAPAPVASTAGEWEEPMEVWATNPFAAALAEAEAAVRAAEPAVPPDLDAALAEALAEAEEAEAPLEEIAPPPPEPLYAEPLEAPATAEDAEVLAEPVVAELPAELPGPQPSAAEPISRERARVEREEIERTREEIERTLLAVGMGEEFVRELIEGATTYVLPLMPTTTSLAQAVRAALAQRLPACPPLPAAGATIAVVGAGGSGKSALCAALAEAYREHGTLPVTCLTIAPGVETGAAPGTAESAPRAGCEGGLLLLDTPPVSAADPASSQALAELLAPWAPERVVLALPATLGATPAAQLLRALSPLRVNALAATHADETDQLGVAVQAACAGGPALAYLLARAGRDDADGGLDGRFDGALTWIDPCQLLDRLLPPR